MGLPVKIDVTFGPVPEYKKGCPIRDSQLNREVKHEKSLLHAY
jgi:hypothetical protein